MAWAGCGSGLDCVDLVFGSPWPGLVLLVFGAGFASTLLAAIRLGNPRARLALERASFVGGLAGVALVLLSFALEIPFVIADVGLALGTAGWVVTAAAIGLGGAVGQAVRSRRPT